MIQTFKYNKSFLAVVVALSAIVTLLSSGVAQGQDTNTSQSELLKSATNTTDGGNNSLFISIPVEKGYVDGNLSYFISTDASEERIVSSVTNTTKFDVNYAPTLSNTSEIARQQGYVFTNGIKGNGPMGYQASIASTNAGDEAYSPLWRIQTVTWRDPEQAQFLTTLDEITEHAKQGHLKTEVAGVVVNCPFVEI